ncbi:MAG: glycosyltransferase family 4 protein, partial [Planctomycetaceae bacterium]
MSGNLPKAIVVSDVCGQRGGAYRATSLLCEALCDAGFAATLFAGWVESDFQTAERRWRLHLPVVRRGCRWSVPARFQAWQASRAIQRERPELVIAVGLTRVTGLLLGTAAAPHTLVWELTNAEPGNKFVDLRAVRLLSRARGMLSPATVIDRAIRQNYGYQGSIQRLPFWIEAQPAAQSLKPAEFDCDFLFLSRRESDKGLGDLLDAAAELSREGRRFRLSIAGAGSAEPFQTQATELINAGLVKFLSLPSRSDAMAMLRRSRFVVLPSHHEGYPISILESLQAAVPLITTPVGAVPEMLGEGPQVMYH